MRAHAIVVAGALVTSVLCTSAWAQSIEIGPGGVRIGRGECNELRHACEDRGVRCGRYREVCGGSRSRGEVCARLRSACVNREGEGAEGEGNCRRYRRTCGG